MLESVPEVGTVVTFALQARENLSKKIPYDKLRSTTLELSRELMVLEIPELKQFRIQSPFEDQGSKATNFAFHGNTLSSPLKSLFQMALNRLRKTEPVSHELFVDKDFESTEEIVQAAL